MNRQKYIIRCDRAGVFFAKIKDRRGAEADLEDCRRIHYWDGAASLSQVATDGINGNSRVTVTVPSMTVLQVIEVIPCSEKAQKVIEGLPEWKR